MNKKEDINTKNEQQLVRMQIVQIDNEAYYQIANNDAMRPFFMSIVSDANHWMFISSNGGLSAGRKNAELALFPYGTDDKITESFDTTGSKSIFHIQYDATTYVWEPFSDRFSGDVNAISRNLYKNRFGNKIIFEEINHDLQITFRYQWSSSSKYGFIRKAELINNSSRIYTIEILDGIQNIMPSGVSSDLQNAASNLVDAYKRSELQQPTGVGIYALSAIIVDKAEPSEALKANTVWSFGLQNPNYLVSSLQVANFRRKLKISSESDIKGEKGAYFVNSEMQLAANTNKKWTIIANVNQDHSDVAQLIKTVKAGTNFETIIEDDVALGTKNLIALNASSDGLQLTNDNLRDTRHFANTLFNIMRGGIFDNNYKIEKQDFVTYINKANVLVYQKTKKCLQNLDDVFTAKQIKEIAAKQNDADFERLCLEYLPLKFSRRHGDPSRPWNKFSINTQSEIDGSKILDYEGNWRDIFQNWEALAHSFPDFIESMIHKFLNATTFDGYNPYRVTKDGFDWETIEEDNPWSYIGYWGDHQIIYLLKFLECIENHQPKKLEEYFSKDIFVYANVPYVIKPYDQLLKNPKDTISFDHQSDEKIRSERNSIGADGALLKESGGAIYKVNFIEKMLATVLAKMSNFIPEAGIWMNTQRPEWNDANNALVGNGVSMVTLCYLRRFLSFFQQIIENTDQEHIKISNEIVEFYHEVRECLLENRLLLAGKIDNVTRKKILDRLGNAASEYRNQVYQNGFWGNKRTHSMQGLKNFVAVSLQFIDHSIDANKRPDNLYHAYNLMTVEHDKTISISHLSEMLEGQVAVLSAGYLSSEQALQVLDGLKSSTLFREDQYSYILYPNKALPTFLEKNIISANEVTNSNALSRLIAVNNQQIIKKDCDGKYHFNSNFKNATDLDLALANMHSGTVNEVTEEDRKSILKVFETTFNHKSFTGRSGTFYGYEGLGSIYWHMVSKLQLAVLECCLKAVQDHQSEEIIGKLLEHYYEINEGIGVHKSPYLYGAFPTDPYSHTPAGKGAQQPGMTGQVKEDILSRFGELGVFVKNGTLQFNPCLLRKAEFLQANATFNYVDIYFNNKSIVLPPNSICFTYCQVPIIYTIADQQTIELVHANNSAVITNDLIIDAKNSAKIFERTGEISLIKVHIKSSFLK